MSLPVGVPDPFTSSSPSPPTDKKHIHQRSMPASHWCKSGDKTTPLQTSPWKRRMCPMKENGNCPIKRRCQLLMTQSAIVRDYSFH
ncbi:hypothetical protein AVEN_253106-1 [Araneus ventricosus]|uniref:Uncharacterized protein n=1 Tax=Araneus ventricosus TaxID=182803 RepID=A0A4Y2TW35_ARAVE|nr:hypothetical protein AVEN_253106-1 [Araneus ventricosus]